MNRLIFQILIVMMVFAVWIPAKAEIIYSDSDTMDIGEVYGQAGQMVDVMVNMANPSFEIAGIAHRIIYDETLLEVDTVVCVDRGCNLETSVVSFAEPGVILITAITSVSNPVPMDQGPVMDISFNIIGNAPDTTAVLSFENTVFYDNAWSDNTGYDLIIPILSDGAVFISSQTGTGDNSILPGTFRLSQNYPNPFNGETNISFTLPEESAIDLCVYDLIGRKVATVFSGYAEAGNTDIRWDAQTADGRELPSGVYFYRLTIAEGRSLTRRMTLLK